MSRTLFENSKAALAFAGMTMLGAVMMVGTAEKGGVLSRLDEHLSAQRANITNDAQAFAAAQSVGDQPSAKGSGWGRKKEVFGEFDPAKAGQAKIAPATVTAAQGSGPMTAPLAPGAIAADAADAGLPVAEGVAVITDRQMTIEPQ